MSPHFDISFTGEVWTDEGVPYESVKLTLNDWYEFENADLTHWSPEDYQKQWLEQLNEISTTRNKGALIVSIHDPARGYRVWIWTMWKNDDRVRFQNRLLGMLEAVDDFDPNRVCDYIGDYESCTPEGEQISEWVVPILAIKTFLQNKPPR